jgi:hypothetical protein
MNLLKKINLIENQRLQFNYLFSLFSTRPLQIKHFLKFKRNIMERTLEMSHIVLD